MKKRTPVSKIMSSNVLTVNHTNSLREVHALIQDKGIHHVPVVSGSKLIGLISKSDLERITYVQNFEDGKLAMQMYDALTIEQVMTKDIISVKESDTIQEVAEILAANAFHALPVLDGEKVVGIVTTTDLLRYLLDQF